MRRLLARPWSAGARRTLVVFVALPIVLFGLPAALGRPWLVGDNLIQNFPLRVLVGTDVGHGHLPLWDPYLWSGSPLLAGFNAGAAYPFTWVFAVLPHALAWVTNQVVVELVASSGMVVLLRLQGRTWAAAGLGAGAFTYGGFMAMQNLHIDLVQAAGWLVWAFVALDRLGRRPPGRRAGPWVALLGVSLGLMVLTGAAEPVLDGGVALVLFAAWLVWRAEGRRLEVIAGTLAGVVIGALIGAAQLLPGSSLQGQSQRALHSYWYFTSGSMNKSLSVLLLDPMLLGIGHSWPLSYLGTYNLPEVCGYLGLLPVMGVVGLLARRHRRHPEARQWSIWYVIGGVGLVLMWGGFTPLSHLEYLVPFYNRQRLLARNLLEVDLAMAVLFAAWADHLLFAPRPAAPDPLRGRRRGALTSDVVLPLLPPAAVIGLQVVLLAGGPWFPHFLHVPGPVSYGRLWPLGVFLTVPSALAVAAGWLVLRGPGLGRRLVPATAVLLAVDLAVFNVAMQVYPQSAPASGPSATADALAAAVSAVGTGPGGLPHRMALFDPDRYHPNEVDAIGQPDLTVLRGLSSVQGYGAIVAGAYDAATGTHLQGNLTPAGLADGTFARLDLGLLVTVPEYFVHVVVATPGLPASTDAGALALPPVPPDRAAPLDSSTPAPTPPIDYRAVSAPATTVPLAAGQPRTWFFGTVLAVRQVTLPITGPATPGAAPAQVRLGLLSPDGTRVEWRSPAEPVAGTVQVDVAGAPEASGLVLEELPTGTGTTAGPGPASVAPVSVGPALLRTAGQGTYRVDGSLRDALGAPQWRFAGRIGLFGVFAQARPAGRAWVEPAGAGTARVLRSPPWGAEQIEVRSSTAARLVRDEAFASGWQATVGPAPAATGPVRPARVRRSGLVQAVLLPPGTHVVTFRYRAHRVVEGLAGSGTGVLLAATLLVSGRRGAGRRRRGAGARRAAARSARGPGGAGRDRPPSAPAPAGPVPLPRGP